MTKNVCSRLSNASAMHADEIAAAV